MHALVFGGFGLFLKIMGGGKSYLSRASSFLSKFLCLNNASNIRALMAQASEEAPFTSEIVGSILATDSM
jgi:hypothetical protein